MKSEQKATRKKNGSKQKMLTKLKPMERSREEQKDTEKNWDVR